MTLHVTDEGPVRTLTFDNPGRKNAIDVPTLQALGEALHRTAYDDGVRVVVLTGAGGDFSSGADLSRNDHPLSAAHPMTRMRLWADTVTTLHDLPQPVIARVEGVVVGAAANLALGCDFVVAATTARFSEIFARRGLSLDAGGSWLLPRAVGLLQAKRLALLGEIVGAEEMLALGLATWVKEPNELDAFVTDLAVRLAAGPPVALALTKQMLHHGSTSSFEAALAQESAAQTVNFGTDAPAARRAFAERTEPDFTGAWRLDTTPDATGAKPATDQEDFR
ncbi:enoyl-CoA hydratase/isomerase family protein [Nocardioides sp. DS6]|uniref:Enoyl-CoA hydratase/isomerase family protein n=1 Tax=Nocardioides eburneus TaxID=3231482 RepID=A0ABV3SZP2_9ACTN